MIFKNTLDPEQTFTAGDDTRLQELIHPKNDAVDVHCSVAHATIDPGQSSRLHHLKNQTEIFFILRGAGILYIEGESTGIQSGDIVHVPPKCNQKIENTEDQPLSFLCIVQPPWRAEDEVILEE